MIHVSRARGATWLLTGLLSGEDAEMIVGDLEEESALRAESRLASNAWYWVQILRSVPVFAWLPIRRGGAVATFAVALTVCSLQAAIELTTGFAVIELLPADAIWAPALALAVTLPSLVFLTYVGTRFRPGAATAVALVAAAAITGQLLLTAEAGRDMPLGTVASLVIAPSMAFVGGFLSSSTRDRRAVRNAAERSSPALSPASEWHPSPEGKKG
jgi:hypothetical protein